MENTVAALVQVVPQCLYAEIRIALTYSSLKNAKQIHANDTEMR